MMHTMARKGAHVRHVAVWAFDRPEQALFDGQGRHVPLCGQKRITGDWEFAPDDQRPFCARCRRLAQEVADLVLNDD